MPRTDLLALTPDDLATLANRGLVKRAQAEIDGGELEFAVSETKSGMVSVLWSDDISCVFPPQVPLQEAKCTCPATTLCRHLIRSVLAYQQEHAGTPAVSAQAADPEVEPGQAPPPPAPLIWNPAEITDAALEAMLPAPVLARARREWDAGHVIETTPGVRPSAYFHSAGVNLRFLVPLDARYTHCDCAESPPCVHVPLAVWAFREVNASLGTGLVSTRSLAPEAPEILLDDLESVLKTLASEGVASVAQPFVDRLNRTEQACREAGLMWPADIVAELRDQIEFYRGHNARFEPLRIAQLCGELLIRADAIRSDTGAVPPLFVRGSARERTIEVGAARLVGIGTHARLYRGGAELQAFLQDVDSGAVVVVKRDFPNPQADANQSLLRGSAGKAAPDPAPLWKLAAAPVAKGVGLGSLGSGQLLVRGGKRAPSGEFTLGRSPASFNPQAFEWEKLRAPLLADNFVALDARMRMLPPAALRPRRLGEDVYVVPIARVENPVFDRAEQTLKAVLRDPEGGAALLRHAFTARGAEGLENLLESFFRLPTEFRFVAGRFERRAGHLVVHPFALVLGDGPNRHAVQPWVDRVSGGDRPDSEPVAPGSPAALGHPDILRDFGAEIMALIGETLQVGLQRSDARVVRRWENAAQRAQAVGLSRFGEQARRLAQDLLTKTRVRHFEGENAVTLLMEIALQSVLLGELV